MKKTSLSTIVISFLLVFSMGGVMASVSCDDGNACTADDDLSAVGLGCMHWSITCNDGNELTTDSCVPATGCVYTPIQTPQVPEFGAIVGVLTVMGALGVFFLVRRK
jgi:hypothetical protein